MGTTMDDGPLPLSALALRVSDLQIGGKRDEAMQLAYDTLNVEGSDAEDRALRIGVLLVALIDEARAELLGFANVLAHQLSAKAEFEVLCDGTTETAKLIRRFASLRRPRRRRRPDAGKRIQRSKNRHPFKLVKSPADERDPE